MLEPLIRYKVYGDNKIYYGVLREQPAYTYVGDIRMIHRANSSTVLCAPFSYQYVSSCLGDDVTLMLFDTGKDMVHLPLYGDRDTAAELTQKYIMGNRFATNITLYVFDEDRLIYNEFHEGKVLLQSILNGTTSNTYFLLEEAGNLALLSSYDSLYYSNASLQKSTEFLASFNSPYEYLMRIDNYTMSRFSFVRNVTATHNSASALVIAARLIRNAGAKFTPASIFGAWIAASGYNRIPSSFDIEDFIYRHETVVKPEEVIDEYQKYTVLFNSGEWRNQL